jgi:fibro-slime domain-containing protein
MILSARWIPAALFAAELAVGGCSANPARSSVHASAGSTGAPASAGGSPGVGTAPEPSGGAPQLMLDLDASMPAAAGAPIMLTGVTATEVGGYKRGDEITVGAPNPTLSVGANDGCGVLVGLVRDFNTKDPGRHPDFEIFTGAGVTTGLVAPGLDADRKPIYASQCELMPNPTVCPSGQQTTSKANFDQWYHDTPGVNRTYLLYFQMQPVGNVVSFQSENFVPMDDAGWDDEWLGLDGVMHNYGFTTELHVKFKYAGGESFTFKGDDDVWAFINGHLAIDLGGLHEARTDSITLDDRAAELGLEKGNVYPLDLFQAERHSTGSHYRIDSTLALVDCGSPTIVR